MPLSNISDEYIKHSHNRFCQGDILRDVELVSWADEVIDSEGNRSLDIDSNLYPYLVVLTQDCDLEQDLNNRAKTDRVDEDKYIQSILLCPAYSAEAVKDGTHLSDSSLRMGKKNSALWRPITQNSNYRYHYIRTSSAHQLPALVIDFKHYLTAPREQLYRKYKEKHYLTTISALYRDNLSARFAQYLSRIGLPDPSTELA